jgi:hypothetical protein
VRCEGLMGLRLAGWVWGLGVWVWTQSWLSAFTETLAPRFLTLDLRPSTLVLTETLAP